MQVIWQNRFGWWVFHGARLIVMLLFPAAPSVLGADPVQDDWKVHIGLPLWVAGIDGAVTVHGHEDFQYNIKQSGPQLEFGLRF